MIERRVGSVSLNWTLKGIFWIGLDVLESFFLLIVSLFLPSQGQPTTIGKEPSARVYLII